MCLKIPPKNEVNSQCNYDQAEISIKLDFIKGFIEVFHEPNSPKTKHYYAASRL